ncbi:MAG: aldehyde dehydrogenase [Fibrobacteres bacterium]|nr:aldehyde dehydrogenase [Fibrobacterota bacterium]
MNRMQGCNYIQGQWKKASGQKTFEQRNPANLAEVTGLYADSSPEDTQEAIAAAHAAFGPWRAKSPQERQAILRKALQLIVERREQIATVITKENGKTLAESRGEIDSAIKEMDFQIAEGMRMMGKTLPVEIGGTLAYSTREPRGAVGVIAPWNFPFNVPGRKCTPALMAGNTVVFKPASLTPGVGLAFTQAFHDAGLPAGVFNCVTGSGRNVGGVIVGDPRIKAISFTGSTPVGKGIQKQAAENLTPCQLELGGKNPAIVLDDADLDLAVASIAKAAYACAGQWCTSTSRVIVTRGIAPVFTERLAAEIAKLQIGDGMDPKTGMGPVCGTEQKRTILGYIRKGLEEGAKLHPSMQAPADDSEKTCFIKPVMFTGVTPKMTIAQEEIFGPVLSVMTVDTFEEAVALANDVPFGLASSIFTRNLGHALTFMEKTDVGLAHVNIMSSYKEPQLEFGGVKESGAGLPEAGTSGILFFTEHKVCYVKYR